MLVLLLVFPAAASATAFTFEYDTEFSGAFDPAGPTPWLEATFDDQDSPGTVLLYLETTNLVGVEFVRELYFNLNPDLDPQTLGFNVIDASDVIGGSVSYGADQFQADGDGRYDIMFSFNANDFTGREELIFQFSLANLVADDFYFLSAPAGGNGPFLSAAHVQGIGDAGQNSGWIAPVGETEPVPEPATMLLLGSGLIGMAGFGRKKFKK
jgi:hypothetical protein